MYTNILYVDQNVVSDLDANCLEAMKYGLVFPKKSFEKLRCKLYIYSRPLSTIRPTGPLSFYQKISCARLFICALWSPAGKGLTSQSSH